MAELECFFDCSSPWTYFAFESLLRMQDDIGVTIRWRPILVGGVFNAVNPSVYQTREKPVPAKAAYSEKDQRDWARYLGLPMLYRPTVFPVNSVKAMRACIVLEPEGNLVRFAREVFKAYWIDDQDISQVAVLTALCDKLGFDPASLLAAADAPAGQGRPARQYPGADRARRVRFAHDLCRARTTCISATTVCP